MSKERGKNKYTFLAASFALSFSFEISHYINITPAFKEKTKNKISYPRIHIYLYLVPNRRHYKPPNRAYQNTLQIFPKIQYSFDYLAFAVFQEPLLK